MDLIDELYGAMEKDNRGLAFLCGLIMAFMTAVLVAFVLLAPVELFAKIMMGYGAVMAGTAVAFMFSSYFFQKKKRRDKFKRTKYFFFVLSLALLAIVFLPVVLMNRFAKIIRFDSFIGHGEIYVMCIVVPIVPALMVAFTCWGNLYRFAWLNSATFGALAAILVWFVGSRLLLCLPHKLRTYSISDDTYAGIKKDLDVVLVGFIAAVSIVGNLFSFTYILGPEDGAAIDGAVKATSAAFVVWLAFDRVKSTWQTKNEKVKTEGASGEGVACKEQDLAVRD